VPNDVTITESGSSLRVQGLRVFELHPAEVAALRAHFAAERMPEDVQKLVDEADHLLSYSRADMGVRVLIGQLAAALKAVYSQKRSRR
jgi:hypothetical protein